MLYANGVGGPEDAAAARDLFARAAAQGLAEAQYNLAVLYEQGVGGPKDLATARAWYEKACAGGLHDACDAARELASH